MNYKRIYDQLIERARNRIPEGYVERHHIIPKCMGGDDSNENLVALYPEEHFVAHALLLKCYKHTEHRYSLAKACSMMVVDNNYRNRRSKRKLYGWLKREHASAMAETQKGEGNSQHGTMWICNVELQQNKKVPKDSTIEEGWVKGRNKWVKHVYQCKICSCEIESKHKRYFCNNHKPNNVDSSLGGKSHTTSIYVTNGVIDKRIKSSDDIPFGFVKGRTNGLRVSKGLGTARGGRLTCNEDFRWVQIP